MKQIVSRVLSFLLFLFFLVTFSVSFVLSRNSPLISGLFPSEAVPGDIIEIRGSGFGAERSRNRVYLDRSQVTSSHILDWSDSLIRLKLPSFSNSALVSVETRSGKSPGSLLINTGYFPSITDGPYIAGYPYIYLEDPDIFPGKRVTISGINLLSRKGSSRIIIKENMSSHSIMEEPEIEGSIEIRNEDVVFWSNDKIQFYYTGYPVSGLLYVINATGHSNPVYIDVTSDSAEINIESRRTYHLSNRVDIDRIAALPGNFLNLRLSVPYTDMRQTYIQMLRKDRNFILEENAVNLYTLNELEPGKTYSIKQDFLLNSADMNILVQSYPDYPIGHDWPGYRLYTKKEDRIPVDNSVIKRLARNLTSSNWSVLRNAESIYFFVMDHLEYDPEGKSNVLDMLNPCEANCAGYAFFSTSILRAAGIPARPVFGVEIKGEQTENVCWIEFFVPGIGWFPANPVGKEQGDEQSWGSLAGNKIAFSCGLESADSYMNDEDKNSVFDYAWQKYREEHNDNLEFMRSIWHDVAVVGTYR